MRTDRPLRSRPAKHSDRCTNPSCPRPQIEVGEEIAYHRGDLMHGVCANQRHGTLPEYAAWIERMTAFRSRHRAEVAKHRAKLLELAVSIGAV